MAHRTPAWFREIDHTGDVGIEVKADSLNGLFARAAWGMFSVLTDMDTVRQEAAEQVTVEAADREALMLRWLSELNYVHVVHHWLFSAFTVEELSDRRIVASAQGEKIDPDRHTVYTEIKAVTFHGLKIAQQEGVWHAQIIFDM